MLYRTLTSLTITLGSILILGSCGDEKSAADPTQPSIATADIKGTWESGCLSAGDQYEAKSIIFTEKSFTFTSTMYTDAECKTISDRIDGIGEYTLGEGIPVTHVGTTTAIDYTFLSYTWSFIANPAQAVNYALACEGADVNGGVVDVLGKKCDLSESNSIQFHSPAYGVVYIESEGKLLLTDASSNSGSKEERSTLLRIDAGWTKLAESAE